MSTLPQKKDIIMLMQSFPETLWLLIRTSPTFIFLSSEIELQNSAFQPSDDRLLFQFTLLVVVVMLSPLILRLKNSNNICTYHISRFMILTAYDYHVFISTKIPYIVHFLKSRRLKDIDMIFQPVIFVFCWST